MLKWFSTKGRKGSSAKTESLNISKITFVCEQDGDAERQLKSILAEVFRSDIHLMAAYLVKVRYTSSSEDQKVALCLSTDVTEHAEIIGRVSTEFRQIFEPTESLDIIFLTKDQEQEVSLVAKPFFRQSVHQA